MTTETLSNDALNRKHMHELPTNTAKWIPNYEGLYAAEPIGTILSVGGRVKKASWRALKWNPNTSGYPRVQLTLGAVKTSCIVHRLIALTFIPNPCNLPEVNHKNCIKTDNRVENLEWVTTQQNRDHLVSMELHPRGTSHGMVKISEVEVHEIIELRKRGEKLKQIALAMNISHHHVGLICRGKAWKHLRTERVIVEPKLNADQVAQVRKLALEGNISQRKIAAMFGIKQATVSCYKLDKTRRAFIAATEGR